MLNHVNLMVALTADYLNVFVVRPAEDSADTIKLQGYVTRGIKDKPQDFSYSKLLKTYANDRVYSEDRDNFLQKLLPGTLIEAFTGERDFLEFDYRIVENGEIHNYSARYSRISNPEEELSLVVAFRNVDDIVNIGREQRTMGMVNAYSSISSIFYSLHRVNVQKNTYSTIKTSKSIASVTIPNSDDFNANVKRILQALSSKWSYEAALEFVDLSTLEERMKGKNHLTTDFLSYVAVSCRLHFFKEDEDENGRLCHVILGVEKLDNDMNQAIVNVLSRDYKNVFWLNFEDGTARMLKVSDPSSSRSNAMMNQMFLYEKNWKNYIASRVHPEDQKVVEENTSLEHIIEVFKDKDELNGNYRVIKEGQLHHFHYAFYRLANLSCAVAGIRNIDDIVAQHDAEESQREEQLAIFNALAHNFKNVYLVNLKNGTARVLKLEDEYADNRLDDVMNVVFPYEQFLFAWISEAVHPEDKEMLKKQLCVDNLREVFQTQDEYVGNYRMLVNGRTIYYQFSINLMQDRQHLIAGFQNVDDIIKEHLAQERKERELAEAHLAEEREHAEMIAAVSTIYSTISRADIDTHTFEVLTSVPRMQAVVGKGGNFDEMKENILTRLMAPEMQAPMREFLNFNTLSDRLKEVDTIATEYKNPIGKWFEARFITKRRDSEGRAKEVLYVARDITSEKMQEFERQEQLSNALAAAQTANKAKSTFLNSMSHDIRTPMNAIIGFTALAQSHMDNKAQVQDYLAKINTSSTHLLSLINDILDMSRIESGTVKLEAKPIHLPDLLHDLKTMIQGLITSRNLNLFIDTQDVEHEDVIADRLRLNQVLINIVGNAIKYTPTGGDIMIRLLEKPCSRSGYATYVFSVKDNGIGMSKDFLDHIFESFTREHTTTVTGIQGTGLGMAITKNIVDMMGGTITAESEEGKGSLFTVTLNLPLGEELVKSRPIPALCGARALVVDDDINTCRSVSKMLRDIEMRPDWTLSGREAVIRAQDATEIGDEYKAYIIDYLMPDMNGIETVRQIRRVISDDVPIIVLTAYDWADLEKEAREAGVTAFVSKPIFMSELRSVLTSREVKEEPEVKPVQHDYSGRRVLLVEDNALNLEIATAILQSMGLTVDTATDGSEAVDIMYRAPEDAYDLIFMDIQMPKMDGFTATHEIRTLDNNRKANIPIVAMTANAFDEDRKKSLEAGMNGHIAKPISIDEIVKVLDSVF